MLPQQGIERNMKFERGVIEDFYTDLRNLDLDSIAVYGDHMIYYTYRL